MSRTDTVVLWWAESTAKEVISFMDKAICNAKEEILKEKRLPNPKGQFISVCLPSNKQKKPWH